MDLLIALTFVIALAVLGILALTLGADSRDSIRDEWIGRSSI
jgi:hypothetical protein